MTYADFVEEVRLMRFAQLQYKESLSDKWLIEKRLREKRIDALIEESQANQRIQQPNLF